jgi:hypothetical protein
MKLFSLFVLVLFVSTNLNAQPCSCENNFLWMKKTFEENDAGFAYILSKKGADAYELHNKGYLEKAKSTTSNKECAIVLDKWLRFFRQGHIGIDFKEKDTLSQSGTTTSGKWEKVKIPLKEFEKYLAGKTDPGYEGIWFAEPYKIGIKKIEGQYVGFVIETTAEGWMKDELKTKFDDNGGVYYLRNKTGERFKKVLLEGKNDLQLGNFPFKRIYPVLQNDAATDLDLKLLKSPKPFLEQLNDQTLILRIPSFEISEKKYIDSVIRNNRALILSTANLIIDVRNNGGGSDASFKEILPFLYTNPVRTVGVEFLSTPLNNQRMLDLSNNPEFDSSSRKRFKAYYDTLQQSPGKFVNLSRQLVGIDQQDTVYTYPRRVGILINEKNGSTTEQFLLAAKQSIKVKLFGVTTFGMLDISNVHSIPFPCGPFELYYGLSKSYRIPGMAIDDIGLQPDYYIDPTIRSNEWIPFTDRTLKNK